MIFGKDTHFDEAFIYAGLIGFKRTTVL